MHKIEIKFKCVTPMFMAGEDQSRFDLRPPSFKGLLRFWWRAWFWGKNNSLPPDDLEKEMRVQEAKIFGTSSNKGNKSVFSLRIDPPTFEGSLKPFPKHSVSAFVEGRKIPVQILDYLSYGTYEWNKTNRSNIFIRKYLPVDSFFTVTFNLYDENVSKDILISAYLLSVFGGCGAKARNGFGSIEINKITFEADHDLLSDLKLSFPLPDKNFLTPITINENIPDFSALSRHLKIFTFKDDFPSWDSCLAKLGEIYKDAKSKLDDGLTCKKRQYIGAPILIQERVGGRWRIHDSSFLERRAKPYFLKVIKTDTRYKGLIFHLPSTYSSGLEKDKNNNPINHNKANNDFNSYCDEFNKLLLNHMETYYG